MALFSFTIPAQYFNVSHDMLRMICIQIVVQFLFNVVHPKENPFFSVIFLQTISFVLIGVAFYWLVVHYFVQFTVEDDEHVKYLPTYNPATHTPERDAIGRIKHPSHKNTTTASSPPTDSTSTLTSSHSEPHPTHENTQNTTQATVHDASHDNKDTQKQ